MTRNMGQRRRRGVSRKVEAVAACVQSNRKLLHPESLLDSRLIAAFVGNDDPDFDAAVLQIRLIDPLADDS